MLTQINGLPAHVLLIHLVVVLLPIAALMLVASALWPAARTRLGIATPVVAFVALVLVPITTNAGRWLQNHLQNNLGHTSPLIRKHVHLGSQLLPWAAAIFVLAALGWWLARRYDMSLRPTRPVAEARDAGSPDDGRAPAAGPATSGRATATATAPQVAATARPALPMWANGLLAGLSVAVAIIAMIQLYRIGDSGAQAVWHGVTSGG